MKLDFIDLVRTAMPEGETIKLSHLPYRLKTVDKDFSLDNYGFTKMLTAVMSYPDEINVIQLEGYTPPLYTCTLKEKSPSVVHKHIIATPQEKEEMVKSAVSKLRPPIRHIAITRKNKENIPEPLSAKEPVMIADRDNFMFYNDPHDRDWMEGGSVAVEEGVPGKKRYRSLFKKYREQPVGDYFSFFTWSTNEDNWWDAPFRLVANMAEAENWEHSTLGKYGILRNYLNATFLRCQEQDKILYTDDGIKACFNTGLQTPQQKDIIMLFDANPEFRGEDKSDWSFVRLITTYSELLGDFHKMPEVATYIDNIQDLVFETKYSIETNIEHIIEENKERLPLLLRNNIAIARHAIEGSIQSAKHQIERNYKIAVPHWHQGKIQLLIPLILNEEGNVDVVLVADRDDRMRMYRIRTILTKEMAYVNARTICKLDKEWLSA